MAISILKEEHKNNHDLDAIHLEIANGDLKAIKNIKEQYALKSIEDVLAFAIGILDKASGKPIAITAEDGTTVKYIPSSGIQKKNDQ